MDIVLAIVYGIIQGLTEFLPVSSSAHLALAQALTGTEGVDLTFDVLLHLGTLSAVLTVYGKDILGLIPAFFTLIGKLLKGKFTFGSYTPNERFVMLVIIATLPLIAALFLKDRVELISESVNAVGILLIINGLILLVSDKLRPKGIAADSAHPLQALFVGLCQLIAVIPGLSRSGSTVTGGLLMGFDRASAVKFSFIMSIPAIIGANLFSFIDTLKTPIAANSLPAYAAGTVAAALVGILAMRLLIHLSNKSSFKYFSYYCFAVGAAAIIFG